MAETVLGAQPSLFVTKKIKNKNIKTHCTAVEMYLLVRLDSNLFLSFINQSYENYGCLFEKKKKQVVSLQSWLVKFCSEKKGPTVKERGAWVEVIFRFIRVWRSPCLAEQNLFGSSCSNEFALSLKNQRGGGALRRLFCACLAKCNKVWAC